MSVVAVGRAQKVRTSSLTSYIRPLRFVWTGPCSVPFVALPPATSTSIRPLTVRLHMSEAKAVVAPLRHRFRVDPAEDPPNLNVGRLKVVLSVRS